MRDSYEKLVAATRTVVRQADKVVARWGKGKLRVVGSLLKVEAQASQLRHFLPLVQRVIAQTKQRVWGGNTRVPGKRLSIFEPHTQVIRKGKAHNHKPNEFGRLVRIDEVENGIVMRIRSSRRERSRHELFYARHRTPPSLLWESSGDGHRGPRIFLRQERTGGEGFGSRERRSAGVRTLVEGARENAERTLV